MGRVRAPIGTPSFTVSLSNESSARSPPVSALRKASSTTPPEGRVAAAIVVRAYSWNPVESGCTSANTKPCRLAELINFAAGASGYDYNCATHTFQWDFGDGKTASTSAINLQHSYAAIGTYNVSLTISNGTQTVSAIAPVKVANAKDCPPLSASSLFIARSSAGKLMTCATSFKTPRAAGSLQPD